MAGRRVGDYMTTEVATLREDDRLRAGVELVLVRRIRHVPILDAGGSLVGIVTDHDVMRALPSPLSAVASAEYETLLDSTPISRIMTRQPYTVAPGTPIAEALRLMLSQKIRGLPVVKDGALVGIFTQSDALRGHLELLGEA